MKYLKIFLVSLFIFMLSACTMGTKDVDLSGVEFADKSFVYDGEAKSIEVTNLPDGAKVSYVGNGQIEIGEYEVCALVSHPNAKSIKLYATLIITDKVTDFSQITILEDSVVYDGEIHEFTLANVPEGATVEYVENAFCDAGEYEVKAVITTELFETYEFSQKVVIEKAVPEYRVIGNLTFDLSNPKAIIARVIVDNDEQKAKIYPCVYYTEGVHKVEFKIPESKNYQEYNGYYEITTIYNEINCGIKSEDFIYDGEIKSLELDGELPEGYYVEFLNNEQTEFGSYEVSALIYDENNELKYTSNAIMTIDYADNEEFNQYLDEYFISMFEGSQISVNFFLKNPADFGVDHYDCEMGIWEYYPFEEDYASIEAMVEEIRAFKDFPLSKEQRMAYDIIEKYYANMLCYTEPMMFMTNSFFGSYLGFQADTPLELAEYKFRNRQDVQDFIDYMNSAPAAFESYYNYCLKQIEFGYGLSDVAIDNVVSQCEKFVAEKDDHYLLAIFKDKLANVEFELTEQEIADFEAKALEGLHNLCDAYQFIAENLPNLKGSDIQVGGLASYGEDGKTYYLSELRAITGLYDLTLEEAIAYIDEKFEIALNQVNRIVEQYQNMPTGDQSVFLRAIESGRPFYTDMDPEEIVALFQELAKEYVPNLGVMPEISVKYVYESLEDNFSPAAYFVSPLDETKYESIYLNGKHADDVNYVFITLAHEGYPGHLYQNVYAKSLDIHNVRKVQRSQGYMEGWAVYMEYNAYNWVSNYDKYPLSAALAYNKWNDILNGLISARIDLGIHGEGWDLKATNDYIRKYINSDYTLEDTKPMYDQIVEIPTNMSMYYLSYSKMQDMHDYAKAELGSYFNEVDFNTVILNCGAAPLNLVEEAVLEYVENLKFILNIE